MTASHHQWTLPPQNPPAVVEAASPEKAAPGALTPGEERALRIALNHIARSSTGKLRDDSQSGSFLPEQREDCE